MARGALPMFVFNRGLVSRLGVARVDIKRLALGAREMINWVVRGLGGMNIRPGFGYLGSTLNDAAAKFIEFVFSVTDTALLELTEFALRVWVSDAVVTRTAVATVVTNGTFTGSLAGWADADDVGGTSSWVAPGYLQLLGNGTAASAVTQTVTIALADSGVEHALNIVIARGPVTLRVGSALGLDDYIAETSLGEGSHSLTFTPTGSIFIRFQSTLKRVVWVDSCDIASAGAMQVASPYPASALSLIRWAASGDITFLACKGYQQYKIERRATRGWSMVKYLADSGPFLNQNITAITMTPSVLSGNGTLTASAAYFKATNVGGLFSHTSIGQSVSGSVTAQNTFTNAIQVTGTGVDRTITINISNTFVATVVLQRSFDSATGPWADVAGEVWTAGVVTSYADGLANQTCWYRLGVKTGGYTSGTADLILSIPTGSILGIARVTGYTSTTLVSIEVLTEFGSTTASDVWQEGQWSDRRGWPSAVAFHEGRIWWAGKDKINGGVSDDFYNFDETTTGDSGPINRSIGSGPVDSFSWLLPLQRLVLGAQGAEFSCRSTSLDEPLSPTNFNLKPSSTQGSAAVSGIKVDASGIFVQRGGTRVYQLEIDPSSYDYKSTHLSAVIPEIGKPGILRTAVQRQPETRIHFIRSDGTVAMLTFDVNEQVICWTEIETDGVIEDAVVLPSQDNVEDDQVYYTIKRTINGSTMRYLEKWAIESDCRPDSTGAMTTNHLGDSYVTYSGAASDTITVASHLEGKRVVVWADGLDVGTAEDSDGNQWQSRGVRKPLILTGAAGTYASTPDSAANSVTGDIDIRVLAAFDDWTPTTVMDMVAKFTSAGNQRTFRFTVTTSGFLRMSYSADGITVLAADASTEAPMVADGSELWVRATLDCDDGLGNHVVTFYTSYDYDGSTGTWTQLGDAVTTAGTTSLFDSTALIEIGSRDSGTNNPMAGKVYRAQLFNGIAGTKVLDMNTSDAAVGAAPWISSATGETWTPNGAATIGALAVHLPTAASNVMIGLPYTATWQSTKLLQMQTHLGSAIGKYKEITGLSLLLADTHARGLQFGRSFTDMDDMPSIEEGSTVDGDSIHTDYDNEQIIFPGDFSTDERVCLRARAPRPCTVLAAVPEVDLNE